VLGDKCQGLQRRDFSGSERVACRFAGMLKYELKHGARPAYEGYFRDRGVRRQQRPGDNEGLKRESSRSWNV
jgi:hypothetical protein